MLRNDIDATHSRAADDGPLHECGLTVRGLSPRQAPYGQISAIDLDKGEIKGKSPTAKRRTASKNIRHSKA